MEPEGDLVRFSGELDNAAWAMWRGDRGKPLVRRMTISKERGIATGGENWSSGSLIGGDGFGIVIASSTFVSTSKVDGSVLRPRRLLLGSGFALGSRSAPDALIPCLPGRDVWSEEPSRSL